MRTAEFEIKDLLVALKLLTDNQISKVELQFDSDGTLVMQGQGNHLIRPRVVPIQIHNRDIRGSLVEEKRQEFRKGLSWKKKIVALLGE